MGWWESWYSSFGSQKESEEVAISPINLTRVSHSLRTSFVLDALRRTQREMLLSQTRIASGRSFLSPSEDPVAASRTLDLTQALAQQEQFSANLRHGDNLLSAADGALTELNELLVQASTIASQTVGDLTTADERDAEAEVVARIRLQLVAVANRRFNNRHIFAGRDTLDQPFVDALGGVAYVGDVRALETRVDEALLSPISVTGDLLFGALSRPIATNVNLTPALTNDTRLDAIVGADGEPIRTGILVFTEAAGTRTYRVDLTAADTIGDVITLINNAAAAAGSSLSATLTATGISIQPGGDVAIGDTGGGGIAANFGIRTASPTTAPITGLPLRPRITMLTPVTALSGGAGIDLTGGLIITNGGRTATVDLSQATVVQDLVNSINNAGVSVTARISEDGARIDVFNQVSGSALTIGENGGATAAALGIRTLDTATPLADLNFGRGVQDLPGQADLQIVTAGGATVDVDIGGAVTLGDVINLINQAAIAAGVSLTAGLTATGNGIRLVDGTSGGGQLAVNLLNLSTAAMDLGLRNPASTLPGELIGQDVNPTRTAGIISALIELENALRVNSTPGIAAAGDRLDLLRNEVTHVHGIVGARAQVHQSKLNQMQDASTTTEELLSQVRDLDFPAAVTRLQSALAQFQANLQTSPTLLNLSLLDFLQ